MDFKVEKCIPDTQGRFIILKVGDDLDLQNYLLIENDVLFSNDTGILGKRNSEFSQQESNLRPSDYSHYA